MNKLVLYLLIFMTTISAFAQSKIETYAELGDNMAIGLSVNSENRLFLSFPNYDGDGKWTLTEWENGKLKAYPNTDWNTSGDYANSLVRVQDLFVDQEDNLWVLDSKPSPANSIFGDDKKQELGKFKLVKINTKTNKVEKVYLLDDLDKTRSALNDVRVDLKHNLAYFSDPGQGAIVVLDLKNETTKTVLAESPFTLADPGIVLTYGGIEMRNKEGKPFVSHVNGIALTHDYKYFYFKPINKENLYRIETKYLAGTLSDSELAPKVEDMGKVGITHGLIADKRGNIYLTTSVSQSISYVSPSGEVMVLAKSPNIFWPDSFGIGTDGYLYFSDPQLQRLPDWNQGDRKTIFPYRVCRIKLP